MYLFLSHLAPSVTAAIDVSGSRVVGGSITLTCDVTGLSNLASDTTISFSGPRTMMGIGNTSLQLLLDPALLSVAGQYTCMATVTSALLNDAVGDTVTEFLRLQSKLKVAMIKPQSRMSAVRKECRRMYLPN